MPTVTFCLVPRRWIILSVITFPGFQRTPKLAFAIAGQLLRFGLIAATFSSSAFCIDQAALDHQLYQAIAKGDMGAVRVLLDNGANLEAKNERGDTPLFTAVENHNPEMVKLLLEKGANISAQNKYKETVLTDPVRSTDPDMLRVLLAANPDTAVKNAALLDAAEGGPVVIQVVDTPAQNGQPAAPAAELPWVTNVRLLLDSGAEIEARDDEGNTSLMRAATYAQTEAFMLLLERGAKMNVRDKGGRTLLIAAACDCAVATMNSSYDIMKILLEKGANTNAHDNDGRTALMMAAGSPDGSPSLSLLLSHGANPMAKDNNGKTALDYTKDSPFPEKARQLKKAMAKYN
jgi:ankyrin repeat protein